MLSTPQNAPQGAVRLIDWGVIRATGEDARKFLHGQLTQDIEHLKAGQARLAGYCSAKGRLLATFVVWPRAQDELLLACSADVLPTVLKRLQMFVLRARCKLTDATAEIPLWGLAGDVAGQALGERADTPDWSQARIGDADIVHLPAAVLDSTTVPRWLWAGTSVPALPALDAAAWAALEVASGVARIVAATAEQFVPQMVNLELVGGVNFQKGCYPGQEIVARSQYRGTLKRRVQVVQLDASALPGQEVFNDSDPGQPAGMVVLAGALPGHQPVALVELKLAALDSGSLHIGTPDGPLLRLGTLPYAIPAGTP